MEKKRKADEKRKRRQERKEGLTTPPPVAEDVISTDVEPNDIATTNTDEPDLAQSEIRSSDETT